MKAIRAPLTASVLLCGALACGGAKEGGGGEKPSTDKPSAAEKPAGGLRIGLVTNVRGRGDQSFNDGALRGVEMWAGGKKYTAGGYQSLPEADLKASVPENLKAASIAPLGVTPVVLTSKAQENYEPNLGLLVSEKVDLAVGVGF